MSSDRSNNSYRMALESTQADLNDIRQQIEALIAMKERVEKAAEALKLMISITEQAAATTAQTATENKAVREMEGNRNPSSPLFASGFRPVPQFTDSPAPAATELRSLAALA